MSKVATDPRTAFRKRSDPRVRVLAYQYDEQPTEVETASGMMEVKPGHWIVTHSNGDFYPCEPGIFWSTYEPVEEGGDDG